VDVAALRGQFWRLADAIVCLSFSPVAAATLCSLTFDQGGPALAALIRLLG
jgi:hypothetical protein